MVSRESSACFDLKCWGIGIEGIKCGGGEWGWGVGVGGGEFPSFKLGGEKRKEWI